MLQDPIALIVDKLDISLLLKATPTPSPTSSTSTSRPSAARRSLEEPAHVARSTSVPPLSAQQQPVHEAHRASISSTISAATTSNITSASQVPAFLTAVPSGEESMEMQVAAQQRPVLPPLMTSHPSSYQHLSPPSFTSQPRPPSPRQQSLFQSSWNPPTKRQRANSPTVQPSPAKRQSKWTPEEDAIIIELRGSGMKWEDISKRLPGRSAISCRLHYQNYLERRSEWDEEKKNRLARLYERLKPEMWGPLAAELSIPWRAAEAMHWQLGEADMARRAGVVPFSLAAPIAQTVPNHPPLGVPQPPPAPSQYHLSHSGPGTPSAGYGGPPANFPPLAEPRSLRSRGGSIGSQRDMGSTPVLPAVSLSGIQPSAQSQSALPSMAEFERGLTSSSEVRGARPPRR